MKFKKLVSLGLSVVVGASMLVGCSTKSVEENTAAQTSDIKIGMVADVGGINDESFNQSAWEGLQQAQKDFGVQCYLDGHHSQRRIWPHQHQSSGPLLQRCHRPQNRLHS